MTARTPTPAQLVVLGRLAAGWALVGGQASRGLDPHLLFWSHRLTEPRPSYRTIDGLTTRGLIRAVKRDWHSWTYEITESGRAALASAAARPATGSQS